MELSFSSIFWFFSLVLPGLVFRRFFYRGRFSKEFNIGNPFKTIVYSIIPGFFIQFIVLGLFLSFNELNIIPNVFVAIDRINSYFKLYNFSLNENEIEIAQNVTFISDILPIIVYTTFVILTSISLGILLRTLIRRNRLDIHYKIFRFKNEWHYYFTNEIESYKNFQKSNHSFDSKSNDVLAVEVESGEIYENKWKGAFLDVLVEPSENKSILYSGFLADYTICKASHKLEHIYLAGTRIGHKESVADEFDYKEFKSKLFIIPYERIINMNIRKVYVNHLKHEKPQKDTSNQIDKKSIFLEIYPLLILFIVVFLNFRITDNLVNELRTFVLLGSFSTVLILQLYVLVFFDSINVNSGLVENYGKRKTNLYVFFIIYLYLVLICCIKSGFILEIYKYTLGFG